MAKFLWYDTPDGKNVAKVYSLKCIQEPEIHELGHGEIKAGKTYECFVRNDSSWKDNYYILFPSTASGCSRNCFEPLPTAKEHNLTGLLETIKLVYKKEFPAIRHISEETAMKIYDLNLKNGKTMSIEEITCSYKEIGKLIENDGANISARESFLPDNVIKKEFKDLSDIVQDLRSAKLSCKSDNIDMSRQNQTVKAQDIEIG